MVGDTSSEGSECKISRPIHKYLVIITLIYYGQATAVCCSIRYGFLADSFSGRNISSTVYGAMEGSMFVGFVGVYMAGGVECAMKHATSRTLLAGVTSGFAVTSLATGVVFLIDNNIALIAISTALRITQGVFSYACSLVAVDFINAQLSTQFDLINGLLSMGFFSGHGLAEVFGCLLYDSFGYVPPFIFASSTAIIATCMILTVIPKCTTYLASHDEYLMIDNSDVSSQKITKAVILPITAVALVCIFYGALQVTVTPFLHDEFGKSISFGGLVLTNVSVGMILGSIITGSLLQYKVLYPHTIMVWGAVLECVGIIITFPPPILPALYQLTPILAFPGVLLASVGEPMITIAALRELYELQLHRTGQLTPRSVTKLTGIWLMGYSSLYYSGSAVAGILLDYLSYNRMSDIFVSLCFVALLICVVLRIVPRRKPAASDDKTPLLL